VKQVAFYVMPQGFANWLFGIPAAIYFPVRILMSQGSVDLCRLNLFKLGAI
jgi:hypothetical protein